METTTTEKGNNLSKYKIVWTIVHVSLVFGLIFTAYKALECVQSSLNFESGLGTISISFVYVGYVLSSATIAAPVVSMLTPKWSIFFSFFSHTLFILANIWPSWYTLPAASLVLGVAAGPYWVAQGMYMTTLAVEYAGMTGVSLTKVAERFSSVFHVIWGLAGPLGNLVAAVLLGWGSNEASDCSSSSELTSAENITFNSGYERHINASDHAAAYLDLLITDKSDSVSGAKSNFSDVTAAAVATRCRPTTQPDTSLCGASHCPYMEAHLDILVKPSQNLVYTLMAAFLCCNLTGIMLAACLNRITVAQSSSSVRHNLAASVRLLRHGDLLLLILPIFYIGVVPGIFYASFTQVRA